MKISVERNDLLRSMSRAQAIVERRTTIPILSNVLIEAREDSDQILVEVLPLTSFLPSREEHQFRLKKNPKEKCHIPPDLLFKYRSENE